MGGLLRVVQTWWVCGENLLTSPQSSFVISSLCPTVDCPLHVRIEIYRLIAEALSGFTFENFEKMKIGRCGEL